VGRPLREYPPSRSATEARGSDAAGPPTALMPRIDLAAIVKRTRNPRRKEIPLRPVRMPATMATDLYQTAYQPVLAAWEQAIPAIMAEYERTLAQMTQDSPADVRMAIDRTEGVVATVMLNLRQRLTRWARSFEAMHRQRWTAAVLSATGVNLQTLIGPETVQMTIEAVIERNVGLVADVSAQARQRIGDAVFRGFTNRAPASEVAKEVREAVAMGRRRAKGIAADQTNKLAAALDQQRRREAGIDTFAWIASGKVNYRPEHQARDGKRYTDDKPPPEMPGQLPYCGCTSRAILVL
jgi:SPP1 gp7 family putative phage head morphogenesis protein